MESNQNNIPEVKLGQYKGLAVTRHVRGLSEKTLDIEMVHQTRLHASYHNSEEGAKRGSRVLLDFAGFMDGKEIPDSRMEKVMVVLGDGKLMPAAEDAIYGHKAGETFRFNFTYPAEFRVPELSGKTAQFEICLHTVERKQVPPVDDALAKSLGFADLEALRESLREKKRLSHEANADRIAGAALLDMAGANLTVELPAELLAQNAEHKDWACTEEMMKLTKDGKALYLHCLPADITGLSCPEGEVDNSVFDRYIVPLYKQASYKPYIIAAMIFLAQVKDPVRALMEMDKSDAERKMF